MGLPFTVDEIPDGEKRNPLSSIGSSRRLESWIDGFIRFTEGTSAPILFRKWAALSIVAGALERKVWVRTKKRALYPNLYVLLVSGPGRGKTDAIIGTDMLRKLPDIHMAPTSVSRASLADSLMDATRTIVRPGELKSITTFNSLYISAEELGNFLTVYEGDFMSALNHLYDCRIYEERKRHMKKGEHLIIQNPQLNILAGTTPGWLASNLPPHAWSEGFTSRLMMVYSGEINLVDPWQEDETDAALEAALEADLTDIHSMFGVMRFEDSVLREYRKWYFGGQLPMPEHPKLEHYVTRRPAHLFKLCMCMSAQRSDDYIIKIEDFERAMEFMLEIETSMPDIFREMQTGGDVDIIDETFAFVENLYIKDQAAVAEYKIINFLMRRAPAKEVKKILEIMFDSNVIRHVSIMGPGGRPTYAPVAKKNWNK